MAEDRPPWVIWFKGTDATPAELIGLASCLPAAQALAWRWLEGHVPTAMSGVVIEQVRVRHHLDLEESP